MKMTRQLLTTSLFSLALIACTDTPADDIGDETGSELDEPELGDTPLPVCEAAMFGFAQLEAELALPTPDLDYVTELYRGAPPDLTGESPEAGGTALQQWVREVGARLGRVEAGVLLDDAAIEQALTDAAALDGDARKLALLDVLGYLREVALLDVRARLAEVTDALPDPMRDPALHHAEWDMAWCVWQGGFDGLALAAGEDWQPMIVGAFESGSAGLIGDDERWAADEYATKPAKQVIEKGSFGVVHRNVLALAAEAQAGDAFAAHEAHNLMRLLEDRMLGRNTPGYDAILAMLAGDLAQIDPGAIERELAIAFVKRARKYCDEALLEGTSGTADGVKGVDEGVVYTKIILPLMDELLAADGFDAEAHAEDWQAFREAVRLDDGATANELSEGLIAWNCAMQAALGIASCTDSADE